MKPRSDKHHTRTPEEELERILSALFLEDTPKRQVLVVTWQIRVLSITTRKEK